MKNGNLRVIFYFYIFETLYTILINCHVIVYENFYKHHILILIKQELDSKIISLREVLTGDVWPCEHSRRTRLVFPLESTYSTCFWTVAFEQSCLQESSLSCWAQCLTWILSHALDTLWKWHRINGWNRGENKCACVCTPHTYAQLHNCN